MRTRYVASNVSIENFDEAVSDWSTYFERVELYFLANGVEDGRKVSTLATLLGGKLIRY